MNDSPILKDSAVFPDDTALRTALKESFEAYEALRSPLAARSIELEWRYYTDGKAWLCKMISGRRNLGWLAPYDGRFVTTCYFTDRHIPTIAASQLDEHLKERFRTAKTVGKLRPISVEITATEQIASVLGMLELKLKLK